VDDGVHSSGGQTSRLHVVGPARKDMVGVVIDRGRVAAHSYKGGNAPPGRSEISNYVLTQPSTGASDENTLAHGLLIGSHQLNTLSRGAPQASELRWQRWVIGLQKMSSSSS
jgi:hypothetical protein